MEQQLNLQLLEIAIAIRRIFSKHLPIDSSLIPFDLIFRIVISHLNKKELTIKLLFVDLPHSEMGMRYHFRRLQEKEWIYICPSNTDKRSKIVLPTNKLLENFEKINAEVKIFTQ